MTIGAWKSLRNETAPFPGGCQKLSEQRQSSPSRFYMFFNAHYISPDGLEASLNRV
ncbi:hypothetical protein Plhal304r1_c064g0151461 [Plasmopara halstedii]